MGSRRSRPLGALPLLAPDACLVLIANWLRRHLPPPGCHAATPAMTGCRHLPTGCRQPPRGNNQPSDSAATAHDSENDSTATACDSLSRRPRRGLLATRACRGANLRGTRVAQGVATNGATLAPTQGRSPPRGRGGAPVDIIMLPRHPLSGPPGALLRLFSGIPQAGAHRGPAPLQGRAPCSVLRSASFSSPAA